MSSKSNLSIGGASLIMIFMIMALNTFCLLSISIAQRDLDRVDRIGKRVQDYYIADTLGERYVEEIIVSNRLGEFENDIELSENRNLHIKLQANGNGKVDILEWNIQNKDMDIDQSMGVIIIE